MAPAAHPIPAPKPPPPKMASLTTQGTVVVQLPADANMFVEGQIFNLTSATRAFVTPELQPGRAYYYTVTVEAVRHGKTLRDSKEITVAAGRTTQVDFTHLDRGVARVTVQVPSAAKLYVDDVLFPALGSSRSFDTPSLEAGRQYYYVLRAELEENGQLRKLSREVILEAGKRASVDFAELAPVTTASR